MTTLIAKRQLQKEQQERIAALIIEVFFGYSSYSSGRVISECEKPIPKDVTPEMADGLHLQQKRARQAKSAAHQIQLFMSGEIE